MSTRLPNGTRFAVSTSLAAAVAITGISNAAEAVASAGTLPAAGDILLLKSGWPELNESPARAKSPTGGTFVLEGIDTTDEARYPPNEGVGSYEKVTTFIGLTQVLSADLSGGDQNFHDFQFVEDQGGRQRRKPTYKSPMTYTLVLAIDEDLPWYEALIELDRLGEVVILRETSPNGDTIYYAGYISFNKVPTKTLNENAQVTATFSINSDPIRYEAA